MTNGDNGWGLDGLNVEVDEGSDEDDSLLSLIYRKLFRRGETENTSSGRQPERPCNISGHDYDGQWRLYGYFARTETFSQRRFRVRKKEVATCTKCDKADTREKVIGKFAVTENDELKVLQ